MQILKHTKVRITKSAPASSFFVSPLTYQYAQPQLIFHGFKYRYTNIILNYVAPWRIDGCSYMYQNLFISLNVFINALLLSTSFKHTWVMCRLLISVFREGNDDAFMFWSTSSKDLNYFLWIRGIIFNMFAIYCKLNLFIILILNYWNIWF